MFTEILFNIMGAGPGVSESGCDITSMPVTARVASLQLCNLPYAQDAGSSVTPKSDPLAGGYLLRGSRGGLTLFKEPRGTIWETAIWVRLYGPIQTPLKHKLLICQIFISSSCICCGPMFKGSADLLPRIDSPPWQLSNSCSFLKPYKRTQMNKYKTE